MILVWIWFSSGGVGLLFAQGTASNSVSYATNLALPPSPMHRSAAYLEQLVGPIALYPDPLIAAMLPASAYPLEIVEAARFVRDTNNLARLDAQPWDANVKAIARVPEVIARMDNDIAWTSDLGEAFIDQPKDLMDAIQTMRSQAQASGALESTAQQDVSDTNGVIEIQPAEPEEVYVPEYNPSDIYSDYSSDHGDFYPEEYSWDYWPGFWPYPYVTFGVGVIFTGPRCNNKCDWHHGAVLVQGNIQPPISNIQHPMNAQAAQRWQPDPNRLEAFGSAASSKRVREARGVVAGNAQHSTAGTARVQGNGAGPQIDNRRLSPTSGRQSSVVREGPAVVREGPAIVREGQPVIYRSDDAAPRGNYYGAHSPESTVHAAPTASENSPSPRGNYYNYQSARPMPMYPDGAAPVREYTPPSVPMHEYGEQAPPVHQYSTPPPMHEYGAPSGGHMGSFGGGFGGGGHMSGFGGGGGGGRGR